MLLQLINTIDTWTEASSHLIIFIVTTDRFFFMLFGALDLMLRKYPLTMTCKVQVLYN